MTVLKNERNAQSDLQVIVKARELAKYSVQSGIHYFGCFNLVNKMCGYYYELFVEVAPKWKD